MGLTKGLPEPLIRHYALMTRTPVRVDAVPSSPLENVPAERAHALTLSRRVLLATQTLNWLYGASIFW
jgi:hypothetical protein